MHLRQSENRPVDKYRSPPSGRITARTFPWFSGRSATRTAAASAAPEEMPYAVIDYGDGSTLEIWKVELVNPSNDWTEGPFFRYTDAKGKSYGYDTDQLRWESVVRLLGE